MIDPEVQQQITNMRDSFDKFKLNFSDEQVKVGKACTEMQVFIAVVKEWMSTTTEYRKSLCNKIDTINEKMVQLPCAERRSWYQAMGNQVKVLWGFIGAIALAIIIEWVKK